MTQTINVSIQHWPENQLCMECENSELVLKGTRHSGIEYICFENVTDNDGITCSSFMERHND